MDISVIKVGDLFLGKNRGKMWTDIYEMVIRKISPSGEYLLIMKNPRRDDRKENWYHKDEISVLDILKR